MLERQLARLVREAGHRADKENSLPWAVIWLLGTMMHRSLTADQSEVQRVRVREGDEVTIALREPDA
jgi:hypothetical protein